jgi:hypothetical protein
MNRNDRNIIQVGDDISSSLDENEQPAKFRLCVWSQCSLGCTLDGEDGVEVSNPYLGDLLLEWFIGVLGNQIGKLKSEFELDRMNTCDSVGKKIALKCNIGRRVNYWRISS